MVTNKTLTCALNSYLIMTEVPKEAVSTPITKRASLNMEAINRRNLEGQTTTIKTTMMISTLLLIIKNLKLR